MHKEQKEEQIAFWEKKWQEASAASPWRKRRQPEENPMQRWNKMAAGFAERGGEQKAVDQRLQTIQWLKDQGALTTESRVLDIGAGPGNWALLLAETAAQVVALEPAEGMVEILRARIATAGLDNISVDQRTWHEVNLNEDGWAEGFDLVFASMTPGIDSPVNLRKMMAASRGYCYLSAFSGRGWQQRYSELWRVVFNESLGAHPSDIIHSFNLLYAMGHRPDMRFTFRKGEEAMPRDKAVEDFFTHLEGLTELNDEIRKKVTDYVDERCQDDIFIQQRQGCQGMMVWDVTQQLLEA